MVVDVEPAHLSNGHDLAVSSLPYDEFALRGAYIFQPSSTSQEHQDEEREQQQQRDLRPVKRRKVTKHNGKPNRNTNKSKSKGKAKLGEANGEEETYAFPKLLGGEESEEAAALRRRAFREVWEDLEGTIDGILDTTDESAVKSLDGFVRNSADQVTLGNLATALIVTGTSSAATSKVFEQLEEPWERDGICLFHLAAGQATNLKVVLKAIIRGAIVATDGVDGYQEFSSEHKKAVPLNYDLELLFRFVQEKELKRIVIAVTDSEAFDAYLLAELISVLSAWSDRIPFVLIIQVAISVELFEGRLPSSAIRRLSGRKFHFEGKHDLLDEVFRAVCLSETAKVWLGPDVSRVLLDQSKEQLATPESLKFSIKYTLMTQFFADSLSILLIDSGIESLQGHGTQFLCEAIRNTPSFRQHSEEKLEAREAKDVKRLLEDDSYLLQTAQDSILTGQIYMRSFCQSILLIQQLLSKAQTSKGTPMSFAEVYIAALSSTNFIESPIYRELMLSIKKLSSDIFLSLLTDLNTLPLPSETSNFITSIKEDLITLLSSSNSTKVHSNHNPLSSTTQTATLAPHSNRIILTTSTKAPTALESAYTSLVLSFHSHLADYFTQSFLRNSSSSVSSPLPLLLSEVLIPNFKSPLSQTIYPKPRSAIERALSSPADYLACTCCTGVHDDEVRGTMPPTAILWRLWCEAGGIVNVRDLWDAFRNIISSSSFGNSMMTDGASSDDRVHHQGGDDDDEAPDENKEEEEQQERRLLTLFYTSMAELKMLGWVRSTKRKVDCIAKGGWKGL